MVSLASWRGPGDRDCSCSVRRLVMMLVVMGVGWGVGVAGPVPPSIRLVVRVRKRRTVHWEPWQINSNVCPPSLCRASSESSPHPAPRPRGTGGSVFYQGDIVLDREVDAMVFPPTNHTRFRRATVRMRNRLWTDGVVPFVIRTSVKAQTRRVILQAIKHISQRTCVTFRNKKNSDEHYIKFIDEPGCWSAIGRTGGEQLLSLGRGCENVGTAVHEITHSLGVWHEQARKDRDSYVRIIEDNISERFLKDFEKVDSRLATSRGFPYDYTSVMHYSRFAFTRNGKPTIEVIGEGRRLGLTIKQRSGLSTIDMAQLRAMYRCNRQSDTKHTRCPKGWHKHDTDCYKFFNHPKVQFAAAVKKCQEENSHLVWIESKREDQFLARHLLKKFPYVYTWRIGARRINGIMKWYRGKGSNPTEMQYSHWAAGQPGSFSSGVLQRDRSTNDTRWEGVWAGSLSQLPYFIYPFICERRAKRKCQKLQRKDGRDYRGKLDHTIDGHTCQRWTEQYPHQHNLSLIPLPHHDHPDGLGDHNYCRNPRAQRHSRPWCYTATKARHWQLCDVTACSSSASDRSRKPKPESEPDWTQQVEQSSWRGRRHSSRGQGDLDRPPGDGQGVEAASGGGGDSAPSSSRRKRPGKGRRRGKGKGRGRQGKRGRRGKNDSKRRRGRKQRKRKRAKASRSQD